MERDDALLMDSIGYAPMDDFQLPDFDPTVVSPTQQPPESESGFFNQFYGSIGKTIFQDNPRLSGRAIEGLGRVIGSDSMKAFGQKIVADFDATPANEVFVPRVTEPQEIEGVKSALDYLGSTLGQGLGSMTVTVASAATGAGVGAGVGSVVPGPGTLAGAAVGGATGGAVAGSFLLSYGDMYDYLVQQEGMDEDAAAKFALIPGTGMAALDATGLGKLATAPFRRELSDKLATRTVQLALRGAYTEGLTEASQGIIQETTGELAEQLGFANVDIEAAERYKNVFNQLLAGSLTGGTVGAATSPLKRNDSVPNPRGELDVSDDIPDAPQTSAEDDAPIEVMVEESQDSTEQDPQVEAEQVSVDSEQEASQAETESEKDAEQEAQKEEDPSEPKGDLSLTSDGRFYSKVFKYLSSLPDSIGYQKTILDEDGNPVQEQEVDEDGNLEFLESGKPKMGPAKTQRVFKVSDIYSEDVNGKARGALSKFPKGELELLGVHEYLIEKSIDAPREAMASERARREKEVESARKELIEAANPLGLDEYVVPELENQEFLDSLSPDDKDFYLENRDLEMKSRKAVEILENEIASIEFDEGDASALKELIEKEKRAYDRSIDVLDPSEFAGQEAEITQDEINQYIKDNQWRLDFGDVRRQTPQALPPLDESPKLKELVRALQSINKIVEDLEASVRAENEGLSSWSAILDSTGNVVNDTALLDELIDTPDVFYEQTSDTIGNKASHIRRQLSDIQNQLSEATESQKKSIVSFIPKELADRIDDFAADVFTRGSFNLSSGTQTGSVIGQEGYIKYYRRASQEAIALANQLEELIFDIYAPLAPSKYPKIKGVAPIFIDPTTGNPYSDPETKRFYGDSAITQYLENIDAQVGQFIESKGVASKESGNITEAYTELWEVLGNSGTDAGIKWLYDWAKTDSIYSENMPARQKRLFLLELDRIAGLLREQVIGYRIQSIPTNLKNISKSIDTIFDLYSAEQTPIVKQLRKNQKDRYEINRLESEQRAAEINSRSDTSTKDLGYVVSDSPPKLTSMSLLGGQEYNKRQILIIDPSKEMRDYKEALEIANEYNQRRGADDPPFDDTSINNFFRKLYIAAHWGDKKERGTGVHLRVHDMYIIRDGKKIKILVVEEVQNDHAQNTARYGNALSAIRESILKSRLSSIDSRRQQLIDDAKNSTDPATLVPSKEYEYSTRKSNYGSKEVSEKLIRDEDVDEWISLTNAGAKVEAALKISSRRLAFPQAVFQNTEEWTQFGMRKAFKIAADEGYGGVAVIGGRSAGPITMMDTAEKNLIALKNQFRDLPKDTFFQSKDLLSKELTDVWKDTFYRGRIAQVDVRGKGKLNVDKMNQTIGLYDFLQTGRLRGDWLGGMVGKGRPRPIFDVTKSVDALYRNPETGKFEKVRTVPNNSPAGQSDLNFNVVFDKSGEKRTVSAEHLFHDGYRKKDAVPFLIAENAPDAGLYSRQIYQFLNAQDPYIGSSANTHYDKNVIKQAQIVAGSDGEKAIGDNILRTFNTATPVFYPPDSTSPDSVKQSILKGGNKGAKAYIESPPTVWIFDEKMTKRLSGPQPLLSTELKDIKGGWQRPLSDLYDEARVERKEGVLYFEDMTGAEQMSMKVRIQQSIANLPGLQYPIAASLGKPGGPSVQIQGHLKGVTVNVQMPNGKISKMPASNLFVGNDRLVETEPKYLLDPKKKKKIRLGHAESIRKAIEEGHDVPPESMAGHAEFGGESGLIGEQQTTKEGVRRLFHGSPVEFEEFRISPRGKFLSGVYLSDSAKAGGYAGAKGLGIGTFGEEGVGYTYEVEVDTSDFMNWMQPITDSDYEAFSKAIDELGGDGAAQVEAFKQSGRNQTFGEFFNHFRGGSGGQGSRSFDRAAVQIAQKAGYKGVKGTSGITGDRTSDQLAEEIVVFDPADIKIISVTKSGSE